MNRFNVKCPECTYPLAAEHYNTPVGHQVCGNCLSKVVVHALPALYRKKQSGASAQEAGLDDAGCYFHESKKAAHVCDSCGRFLCELCALPMGEETLCTSCLEHHRSESSSRHDFIPRQFRYDRLALGLAIIPLVYFPLTLFTAPAVLFIVLRYRKKELFMAQHVKGRMVTAFILGLLEVLGWLVAFIALIGWFINE
ncbi:MAG: hypothetical protein JXR25_14370 [Pontiellaceae bacterium]|nr:hypothetical protein [Pontiellaceae bacterium]MBN2786004.1 hypothetical protein [Pontiellaceae bacterium]